MNCTQSRTSEQNKALAAWLKQKRIKAGLTMRDLAAKLGTPHSTIGKIENCDRRVDVVELLAICSALGTSAQIALAVAGGAVVHDKGFKYVLQKDELCRKEHSNGDLSVLAKLPRKMTLCEAVRWFESGQN